MKVFERKRATAEWKLIEIDWKTWEKISMKRAEMPGWLCGSEMGELILDHDWTESGLGTVSAWPSNLKFAISTILLMPSAALLLWGPRHIQIYNDSYRDLMGLKHPDGLGQPVSDCWPEVWNFLAPICEGVMQRRESFIFNDEPLVVNRTGTPEEAFFRLTYSPIPDDIDSLSSSASNTGGAKAGGAPGIFVTVSETTETINERAWEAERARLREALQAKRIQLLEEVFHNAPSFLYVLRGPGLVFELANEAYYQLVGHRELLGRPLFEALPEAVEDNCRRQLAKVMATGKPFIGCELPITVISDPDQPPEKRFIDAVYLPLLEEDGSYEYVLGHGVDVTEHVEKRKKAEEALRETERRFRDALEIDTVGVIFLDKYGQVTEANDAVLEMSGFSREDEQAGLLRCDELTPPEWMATTLRAGEELKATGRATPYEKELFRKDGSRWWALIAAMQLNEKEGVVYIIVITERKRVEQNLRESEARFRAMAEASPALTWQVNAQGDLVYVNQRVMNMVGMTLEELLPSRWRSILHPDDEAGCLAAIEQALRDRSRFQYRVRARGRGGEWHWLESYALPWFTGPDEYAGHVGVSIDITEAVKAETALREADLRKDEFLATLAHELRNPLAPIANALAIIARPEGATAVPHLLPVINRQVNYMIRLVDDLLEISRITSGKVELRQASVDLAVGLHHGVEAGRPEID